jgi:hypothetical protein
MNAEENLADSDGSDSDGATVTTDVYMWEDMVNYIGRREMFIGVCGIQDSEQGITEIIDIF